MDDIFAAAEVELGRPIAFCNSAERERFIGLVKAGMEERVKTNLRHEIRNTIIPAVRAELIPLVVAEQCDFALDKLAQLQLDVEAEIQSSRKDSGTDPVDDVMKEHRAQQQKWRDAK